MREAPAWRDLRNRLRPYGRFERVENRVGAGMPDVYYTLASRRTGWLELKYLPARPVYPTTPVVVRTLTLEQVAWLRDHAALGATTHLLLRVDRALFLLDAAAAGRLRDRGLTYLDLASTARWSGPAGDPTGMLRCL